jgi:para-aminobenzoate synthetase component I
MVITSLEQWRVWAQSYNMLPFIIKLELAADRLESWEEAWRQAGQASFVLESGKGGRYSILGLEPISILRGTLAEAEITEITDLIGCPGEFERRTLQAKPLEAMRQWMAPYTSPKVPGAPKFIGGCVGFWGYDIIRSIEKMPEIAEADLRIPDYAFALYNQVWILDHVDNMLYIAVHTHAEQAQAQDESTLKRLYEGAAEAAYAMADQWRQILTSASKPLYSERKARLKETAIEVNRDLTELSGITPAFSREDYIAAVERIQAYIAQGDVFQVNLSVRQSRKLSTSPEWIYECLREINPSPYMGLMRFADFTLVSASPELLVQLEDGMLRTRPIAGTRPRGATMEEDRSLADELIQNEKERAEHVMLVDLERNDLGRISEYGTVKVEDFMVIESYSHVMHIVSQVEGKLAAGKQSLDVIAATFPGGTITGAPKIRTMEIIDELEPVRRGPYTGSMGWIDYNGNLEFNIIIRTLVSVDGTGHVQAGAGIVIDSVPAKEYTESLNKAKALWKAIACSEAMLSGVTGNGDSPSEGGAFR